MEVRTYLSTFPPFNMSLFLGVCWDILCEFLIFCELGIPLDTSYQHFHSCWLGLCSLCLCHLLVWVRFSQTSVLVQAKCVRCPWLLQAELFCHITTLFHHITAILSHMTTLFCHVTALFHHITMLFWRRTSLFCHITTRFHNVTLTALVRVTHFSPRKGVLGFEILHGVLSHQKNWL